MKVLALGDTVHNKISIEAQSDWILNWFKAPSAKARGSLVGVRIGQ